MDYINSYNEHGRTKLMEAADAGDLAEVRRLLELGADPALLDERWRTTSARMLALRKSSRGQAFVEIARLLEPPGQPTSSSQHRSRPAYVSESPGSGFGLVGFFFLLGFVSLLLAPFTGVTVVTAAAFFVIGYILSKIKV